MRFLSWGHSLRGGILRGNNKWPEQGSNSGYFLKTELTELADGLDVGFGSGREESREKNSRFLTRATGRITLTRTEMEKTVGRNGLGGTQG